MMANLAAEFAVTVRAVVLFVKLSAGIVIDNAALEAAVGVPLTVIVTAVASTATALLAFASNPAGKLVIHAFRSSFAAIAVLIVSLLSVITTSLAVIAVFTVPLISTLATVAAGVVAVGVHLAYTVMSAVTFVVAVNFVPPPFFSVNHPPKA